MAIEKHRKYFLVRIFATYSSFHLSSAATVRRVARDKALAPVMTMTNTFSVNSLSVSQPSSVDLFRVGVLDVDGRYVMVNGGFRSFRIGRD